MRFIEMNFHRVFGLKSSLTADKMTAERSLTRMFQHMCLQVIALPKTPDTLRPRTLIRPLIRMNSLMKIQILRINGRKFTSGPIAGQRFLSIMYLNRMRIQSFFSDKRFAATLETTQILPLI
jgi:hypothetical protein